MKQENFEGIDIYEKNIYEFKFDTFYLRYDFERWYVEDINDEFDEIIILEDLENEIKFEKEEIFFNSQHLLTIEMFNSFKKIVYEDVENENKG